MFGFLFSPPCICCLKYTENNQMMSSPNNMLFIATVEYRNLYNILMALMTKFNEHPCCIYFGFVYFHLFVVTFLYNV